MPSPFYGPILKASFFFASKIIILLFYLPVNKEIIDILIFPLENTE